MHVAMVFSKAGQREYFTIKYTDKINIKTICSL